MVNFLDIAYLRTGTARQRKAYLALKESGIMEKLSIYDPILVGTIPINIDLDHSDLDIICHVQDPNKFIEAVFGDFSAHQNFKISENSIFKSIKASFLIDDFEVEIFGQNIPTQQQNGYRHLLIESQILQERGEKFRQEVIELKKQGYKTEPAFAKLLGLSGDPYQALLTLT